MRLQSLLFHGMSQIPYFNFYAVIHTCSIYLSDTFLSEQHIELWLYVMQAGKALIVTSSRTTALTTLAPMAPPVGTAGVSILANVP